MNVIDATTPTSSTRDSDWFDASAVASEDLPLPSTRVDWLKQAMSVWCQNEQDERPSFTPALNS